MLGDNNLRREEELRRLGRALHNLRRYIDVLLHGDKDNVEMNLYWDSWDRQHLKSGTSPHPVRSRTTKFPVPSEDTISYNNNTNNDTLGQSTSIILLSTNSPPSTLVSIKCSNQTISEFSMTPPSSRKNQKCLQIISNEPDVFPLTKSKSHESQLANRLENGDTINCGNNTTQHHAGARRSRLPTEPGGICGNTTDIINDKLISTSYSPIISPPYSSAESDDNSFKGTTTCLQIPKSPRTPTVTRGMAHIISHRFTKAFVLMTTCDYCDKQIFIGLKCKECKYKCHRDCESKVPPSCGLPQELFDEFKRTLQGDGMATHSPVLNKAGIMSPNYISSFINSLNRKDRKRSHPHPSSHSAFPGADSSSNTSSCNSSTPSSPALLTGTTTTQHHQTTTKQQFHFPDVTLNDRSLISNHGHKLEGTISSDSDRTVSVSGSCSVSTDSERTPVRVDSQDSQVSDGDPGDSRWPRQNSLSMREWEIPYDELKIGEPIGTGRFGTVYRGNWHGDVAIKVLNMDYYSDDDKTLEAFKLEVATFRKTRHENLVLFMGACMKPPRLAIVTSMSKGMTLYTHIHLRKDKFNMNKTTIIAQQISQVKINIIFIFFHIF